MIEAIDVTFKVGGRTLLKNVNFRLRPGELCAITGANGAGKSTLLKVLCRELRHDSGKIEINGRSINDYGSLEMAQIRSVLSQQNRVSLPFKVAEIVMMGRYPFFGQKPGNHDHAIVENCLNRLEITHLADRLYPTLSGGEQQRVQIAKTLAQVWKTPNAYIFLDEPTTGLDLKHQHQLIRLANELANSGYGIVAVIHDLNVALQHTDKVLLLNKGEVHAFGKPADVLTPTNIQQTFGITVNVIHSVEGHGSLIIPQITTTSLSV